MKSCIEHYLALIAACMPTLGPFFRYLRPSRWRHMADGHKDPGDNQDHISLALSPGWRPKNHKSSPDSSLIYSVKASQTIERDLPLYSMRQSLSREPVWQHPKGGLEVQIKPNDREGRDDIKQGTEMQVAMAR